jgi:hypothetical protein
MQTPLESCAVIEHANGRLRNESHSSSQELACPPFYSVRHERDNLMALPEGEYDLIRYYTFTESDYSWSGNARAMPTGSASPPSYTNSKPSDRGGSQA